MVVGRISTGVRLGCQANVIVAPRIERIAVRSIVELCNWCSLPNANAMRRQHGYNSRLRLGARSLILVPGAYIDGEARGCRCWCRIKSRRADCSTIRGSSDYSIDLPNDI